MARLHEIPCPVLVTDLQGDMLDASREMVELLLGPGPAWHGQPMDRFLPPAGRAFLQTHLWPTLLKNGGFREAYLKLRGLQGQALPCLVNARLMEGHGPTSCIWVFFVAHDRSRFEAELIEARTQAQALARDLAAANDELTTAQHQLRQQAQTVQARNQELDLLSQTDPLTGLGNRRMLKNTFTRWLPVPPPGAGVPPPRPQAALLLVDADHFKCINDRWGHDEGDRVLVELAHALRRSSRRSDLVVRHGGEEFIVWLPDADLPSALRVAEHIHAAVTSIMPGGEPAPLTVSIGVAVTGDWAGPGPMDLGTLVSAADQATYRAKAQGRNQTVYQPPPATATAEEPTP